jgi:hypothetical protein
MDVAVLKMAPNASDSHEANAQGDHRAKRENGALTEPG